jgi:hypothetical protein
MQRQLHRLPLEIEEKIMESVHHMRTADVLQELQQVWKEKELDLCNLDVHMQCIKFNTLDDGDSTQHAVVIPYMVRGFVCSVFIAVKCCGESQNFSMMVDMSIDVDTLRVYVHRFFVYVESHYGPAGVITNDKVAGRLGTQQQKVEFHEKLHGIIHELLECDVNVYYVYDKEFDVDDAINIM